MSAIRHLLCSEADTQALAKSLAALTITGSVWLSGDLGAGKTTLTRYWLQQLGHKGMVKSPTYTLVEPYLIDNKPIYHADLYRLQDPRELEYMGFFDYLAEPNSLVIIEWASRAKDVLPKPVVNILITRQEDDTRLVEIVGLDLVIDEIQKSN